MLIDCPIPVKQLIEWINTSKLPYYDIKRSLPSWMHATGRDRFNLEKARIHPANFFLQYNAHLRPVVKPYIARCFFQSSPAYFYQVLLHVIELVCEQVYFPFDEHTRPFFDSMCKTILQAKSTGRRFLSTSLDIELAALLTLVVLVLLRSIHDPLLDQFLQNLPAQDKRPIFSCTSWLRLLNALARLESIRHYEFYGRTSVLVDSITDSHSKLRYTKSLSKIFDRNIHLDHETMREDIREQENLIRQSLGKNAAPGSLEFAMKTDEFFTREFPDVSSSESFVTSYENRFLLTSKGKFIRRQASLFSLS